MSSMMGYEFFGTPVYSSDQPQVNTLTDLNISDAIYDEVYLRENTDPTVDTSPAEDPWYPDTRLDAKFNGSLEAGNISNNGIAIQAFAVNRLTAGQVQPIQIATVPFQNGIFNFTDISQPAGSFVYSLVPIDQSGFQGVPISVSAISDFYGWWIVDPTVMQGYQFYMVPENDTHNIMVFGTVQSTLNQGRIEIQTLSKYPSVYYTDEQYHTFDLTALMNPVDYSFQDYMNIVNFITGTHRPLVVKSGSGDLYVCDVYTPKKQSLLNAYSGTDYYVLTVSCMEMQDYDVYMASIAGQAN